MRGDVLLVDDDRELRETLAEALRTEGFVVEAVGRGADALAQLRARPFDVVLTDLRMQGMDGLELCRQARAAAPTIPVVVITGFGDLAAAVEAIRAGAYDFLAKPVAEEALTIALDRAVEHARLNTQLQALQERIDEAWTDSELLGDSQAMQHLRDLTRRAAATCTTVLVTGETGTGKELVARALHTHSSRSAAPFVAVNCAAVPEALLESELFGHAPGAFTDAKTERRGLFQRAHGGTIFLDEVGDMPLPTQAKLLRVLQERTVRPVGSDEEVEVDVRVVAATHTDLEAAIEDGSFRKDLLYRLNVIQLTTPPLRNRGNDVLLLAHHFLRQQAARMGRRVTGITSECAARLLAYDWPGNVRELQNCIERAVALTQHTTLSVGDLAPKVQAWQASLAPGAEVELVTLAQVERRHVLAVLQAVDGNKAKAASILGIGRKTLYRKLEQYEGEGG